MRLILFHKTVIIALVLVGCCLNIFMTCGNKVKELTVGPEGLTLEYIAHACFLLSDEENTLLIDPFADSIWISYTFPKNITADAVFSTHPHYDHDGGIFRGYIPYWKDKKPFYTDPGSYTIGNFHVTGIKGKHCDPYGKEFDQKNTIFIFHHGEFKIVHWGDNGPITDSIAASLVDIDILMLPIDDEYHILKQSEIDEIIRRIKPKIIIPMHYRIDELEPNPGKPKDLGPILQFISKQINVQRLENNVLKINEMEIEESPKYLVFKHSPRVTRG